MRYSACLSLLLFIGLPMPAAAGPWSLGAGRLSLEQSAGYWSTDRKFASALDRQLTFAKRTTVKTGQVIPFDPSTGGRLTAVSLTTRARLGLTDSIDVGFAVPLLALNFDTEPVDTVDGRFGLGDVILTSSLHAPVWHRLAAAVELDIKVPSGRFDPSAYAVPLTEGQWDFTPRLSVGLSVPSASWLLARAGYRFRLANQQTQLDPGDELVGMAEVGTVFGERAGIKVAGDLLLGAPGHIERFAVVTPVPRRYLLGATLAGWLVLGAGVSLDVAARALLWGRDHPTGVQLHLGIRWATRLFGIAA